MGWRPIIRMPISQTEDVRFSPLGIAGPPRLSDLYKTQRNDFSYCRCHGMTVNAVVAEIIVSDGQQPVVCPAMSRKFDLDTREHTVPGKTKGAVGRKIQAGEWAAPRKASPIG